MAQTTQRSDLLTKVLPRAVVLVLAAVAVILVFAAAQAQPVARVETDVNLITAIDVSDSVTRHDEWLQVAGLAKAVVDPAFLDLLQAGFHGRVGFVAYSWSSDRALRVVVPWTIIASPGDARRVAALLHGAPRIDRSHYESGAKEERHGDGPFGSGGRTDIAMAIDFATRLARAAPYAASRSVVNVMANGTDNQGEAPTAARARALDAGLTINGVAIGRQTGLPAYFADQITGGPGSFVMTVQGPDDLARVLRRKFWRDLIAAKTDGGRG